MVSHYQTLSNHHFGRICLDFFPSIEQANPNSASKKRNQQSWNNYKFTPVLSYDLCKPSSKLEFLGAFCSFTKLLGSWQQKVTTGAVELLLCGDPYRGLGRFGKSNVGETDTPNIGLVICWNGKCLLFHKNQSWGKCWYPWDGTLNHQPCTHLK